MGVMPGLKAFVAAILGGIGNIPGAALGGLILGPALPGLLNDYVFQSGQAVGWSLALTVGAASLVSAMLFLATWRPYRRDYALMHGGAGLA